MVELFQGSERENTDVRAVVQVLTLLKVSLTMWLNLH